MTKPLEEIKTDLNFIKSHTLQPKWYKILKVFVLVGFFLGYYTLFGLHKTLVFFAVFFFLSLVVHMVYRVKTHTWQRSWLDFVVIEENNEIKADRIGKYYYSAVALNAILALLISQIVV
jgi:hypothetical protein